MVTRRGFASFTGVFPPTPSPTTQEAGTIIFPVSLSPQPAATLGPISLRMANDLRHRRIMGGHLMRSTREEVCNLQCVLCPADSPSVRSRNHGDPRSGLPSPQNCLARVRAPL